MVLTILNVQDKICTRQRNTLDYTLFFSQSPIPRISFADNFLDHKTVLVHLRHHHAPANFCPRSCYKKLKDQELCAEFMNFIEKTDVIPGTCSCKKWANTVEKTFGDILGGTTRPNARTYQYLPFWNNDLRLLAQSVKQHSQRFGNSKDKEDSKLPVQAKRIDNLLQ